ncbi:hypothetical protein TEA_020893 [Camellia sinensis var. sinensis]|uniref:Cwf19-like C-terminal domain-containing protein n=1 Tax=Camellia sinensis var. sinensis TaxID=542762 RepID=A0A4S4D4T6_CAMSN|nr:hypothetical protein TEA_020893 [Camellia sinensis var. sinensis]
MEERVKRDREVWQRLRGRRGFCFQQSKKMKIKEPAKQIHGRRSSTFVALIVRPDQMKENPRELNPYFKNNGTGYPEEAGGTKAGRNQLLSSAVVGDGGASWRLKALKRAQEQAAREGMALEEVVGEQWGSLGQLAVSVASRTAAPSRAHLRAIKNRKKGLSEEQQTTVDDRNEKVTEKNIGRERLRDRRHSEMKVPKLHDSLSWGKRKSQSMSSNKDSDLISTAMASLNKFANDGNFMSEVIRQQNDDRGGSPYNCERNVESEMVSFESQKPGESSAIVNQGMSANQLAAKALQLCLKGKHEEAEKLLELFPVEALQLLISRGCPMEPQGFYFLFYVLCKEVENIKAKQGTVDESSEAQNERNKRRQFFVSQLFIQFRYGTRDTSIQQRKKEDDADMHLAQKIAQNKQYSISGRADDEYDFDDGPRRKTRKKGAKDNKLTEKTNFPQRIFTQQERCQFCFENPSRPRHLVVAIANFTYLSLPHWQSIVPGHCCILTSQHESATRAVDNNVWDEIRNFKKCLIMMFAKQGKDVVFLETVMGLAQQRRHCMVECIPLPQDIAKQAPLYFKKAIDEAEGEWSQHNSKKLIDTSEKGLRGSIPKDFPYFHVEFELNKGFVHVMDDEKQFKSNFGLNVIRGMLRLPEEDMYGRRKHDSVETQKQAVAQSKTDVRLSLVNFDERIGVVQNQKLVAEILKEVENIKVKQGVTIESKMPYGTHDTSIRQRKKIDDSDMHLAQKIAQNKEYSISGRADDEYDFDDGPRRKIRKKGAKDNKVK